jgi:hypothetical protein
MRRLLRSLDSHSEDQVRSVLILQQDIGIHVLDQAQA